MILSIIVPIYNVAPYLCKCVDSLLMQDISDYEIILVDDGSTDDSGAIADEISSATIIIVAQRVSTILHADEIIVLEDGKIVGEGTHEELIKNNEVYRQIAASQLSASDMDTINA